MTGAEEKAGSDDCEEEEPEGLDFGDEVPVHGIQSHMGETLESKDVPREKKSMDGPSADARGFGGLRSSTDMLDLPFAKEVGRNENAVEELVDEAVGVSVGVSISVSIASATELST